MQYENKQIDIQNKLNDYENQYQTTDNLLQLLTQKNMAILNEEAALKDLAQLPAGYASFDEFNNQYQSSQRKVEDLGSQLSTIKAKLEGLQMDKSTDELKQTMDEAELEWKRRLEEAKAYALIQQQIEARERNQQQDPFCEYKVKMQETFFKLTGNKYSQMEFSGLQPVSVSDQQKSISPDWLSQGTKDSLALTIRLTMADYYLKDRPGFLLLDDPMTNMDPDRKKLAQEQLDDFAQNRQVILLGCANSDNP
jgi:exonuclease SbcC